MTGCAQNFAWRFFCSYLTAYRKPMHVIKIIFWNDHLQYILQVSCKFHAIRMFGSRAIEASNLPNQLSFIYIEIE